MSPSAVGIALAGRARVGEGPVWDVTSGTLYWVDILAGEVHGWRPGAVSRTVQAVPTLVGAAAPRAAGGFVAATAEGVAVIAAGVLSTRAEFLPDGVRMNDAKVDRRGRLWAGSCAMDFAPGAGALHLVRPDWTHTCVLADLTQPNGLDWSPDDETFYLIDTARQELVAWDFDLETAELAHQRVLVRYSGDDLPDGMTVDAAGELWIAMWGGGRIEHRRPDGELVETISVPVVQPTSCAFGGPDLATLYVTTAAEGLPDDSAPDGSLLAVTGLGARGLPSTRFAG